MAFHEEYFDVLQNIEFGIFQTYSEYPDLSDYDVIRTLEALVDNYIAEKIGRQPKRLPQSPKEESMFNKVKDLCEWRLGRNTTIEFDDEEIEDPQPITVNEIIDCLKKILSSAQKWSKRGGSQGYLNFMSQFFKKMS